MGRRSKTWAWERWPVLREPMGAGRGIGAAVLMAVACNVVIAFVWPLDVLGDALLPAYPWMPLSVQPLWWLANLFLWRDWKYCWHLLFVNTAVVCGAILLAAAEFAMARASPSRGFETVAAQRAFTEGRSMQVEALLWIMAFAELLFALYKLFSGALASGARSGAKRKRK